MSAYPIKLVRDRIDNLRGLRTKLSFGPVPSHDEHVRLLRRKLIEEAVEYMDDPCLAELADVLAVVRALAHVDLVVNYHKVEAEEMRKFRERGGFDGGTIMYAES